jgi:large subunit ribosomal protein L23
MEKSITLKPIMSEKAYGLSRLRNTYVFAVPKGTNKHNVARAVSAQYEVTVTEVNITNIAGKAKRTVRKSGRAVAGRQSDVRKAYVTLKAGDSLPIFAALEQEAAEAEKNQEALAKASEKAAKKADRKSSKDNEEKDK